MLTVNLFLSLTKFGWCVKSSFIKLFVIYGLLWFRLSSLLIVPLTFLIMVSSDTLSSLFLDISIFISLLSFLFSSLIRLIVYSLSLLECVCSLLTLGDVVAGMIDLIPISGLGDRSALGLKGNLWPRQKDDIKNKF